MTSAPKAVPPSVNAWNAEYLDEQYRRFQHDPNSVPDDVRAFLQGFDLARSRGAVTGPSASGVTHFQAQVDELISAYRELGHTGANLDPFDRAPSPSPVLDLGSHGLGEQDLDRTADATAIGLGRETSLREIVGHLRAVYCGTIGAEIMHVTNPDERRWLLREMESGHARRPLTKPERVHVVSLLLQSEAFEKFLGKRYLGEKRFSLEGGESTICLLDQLCEHATETGVEEIVLGMAHRGRLNVLNNVMGKSYEQIFTEFEDNWEEDFVDGGGDVKYHRGFSSERVFRNGKTLHLAMASNPSHLEAVGPVVLGRCRAKQRLRCDVERKQVIPVLIHGDAAIAGQGIVAETLNMSQLEGYYTGGTVHLVINNLIGFTTSPEDSRSSRYCTDVAKMVEAPVLHVNGEDPEAVVACARVAIEYRQMFKKDIMIDLYCYRRYGHNEQDEASFTQPVLSKLIRETPSVLSKYSQRLRDEDVLNDHDMEIIQQRLQDSLEQAQTVARDQPQDPTVDPGAERWSGLSHEFTFERTETAVDAETLREVSAALAKVPEGFNLNPKLKPLLKHRGGLLDTGEISYADAESLAFGSLLLEGFPIRLTGQDSRRGTFSHRHAVLRDTLDASPYIPLNHMREMGIMGTDFEPGTVGDDGRSRQARYCVYDSPLSEASVLAFEYGYALADPGMMVLWEAQFGDFVNGAQVITDQFLSSAEIKWQRWCGLVLLLPHGYEGAGPEHSSARLERFLQLCGDGNMQVIYPSTAAQTFHMFRRQLKRDFRKPLVVMTPKSLLRTATSTIDELSSGTFEEILDDPAFVTEGSDRSKAKRVVYCTGKIYHELASKRAELERTDVALVRIEQLYPFHADLFCEIDSRYPKGAERVWVQEEPRNMGAFHFVRDAIRDASGVDVQYIGRDTSATPATGSKKVDREQQRELVEKALSGTTGKVRKSRLKEGAAA